MVIKIMIINLVFELKIDEVDYLEKYHQAISNLNFQYVR